MVHSQGLKRILCNYALLLSELNRTDTFQEIISRLEEIGIKELPENEEWSEEEEEEANVPAVI